MQPPRAPRWRRRLLAPLIYLAALLLMFEEWLWDTTQALLARVPDWPWLRALQQWVGGLPPYAALVVFAAPTALLLPVKLLALWAIGHGHPSLGLLIILTAKVLGTALVARIYALTRRSLLSLAWFARWHDKLLAFKDRVIAQLHASAGWRQAQRLVRALKRRLQALRAQWQARADAGAASSRLARLLRRLVARMKKAARKRPHG